MKNLAIIFLLLTSLTINAQDQNLPYSKFRYFEYEKQLNKISNRTHSAAKPYLRREIEVILPDSLYLSQLLYSKNTWLGQKIFNQNLFKVKGENYWFTMDPVVNFQGGKDFSSDYKYSFVNTRGFYIEGQLGSQFSFQTAFYESQARFADYINNWSKLNRGVQSGGLVPGQGIAKSFMDGGFDYPMAEAVVSYTPSAFFNFQFGTGKNFIGDGYRSFLLSDAAFNYPFFKISTNFWDIKYSNYWMLMQDIRPEIAVDGVHQKKFVTAHYLSWNVNERLNIGLYESIVWADTTGTRGFELNYLNPVIFYRPVEISLGSTGGNAVLGFTFKYKLSNNFNIYGQAVLDEFTLKEVTASNGYWANKFAFQFGFNSYSLFGLENFQIKSEVNWARPFTFSHRDPLQNYGHFNQGIGHPWGANFWESANIIRYRNDRFYCDSKLILGLKGYDFDNSNYGGNIYKSYNSRTQDYGNKIGQGNGARLLFFESELGYILNPVTNLKVFGIVGYRKFNIDRESAFLKNQNSAMISFGIRTDLFNTYYDF